MPIDIESLSYDELIELQHFITKRLKHLDSISGTAKNLQFEQGDEVNFVHPTLGRQKATLLKFNKKTVSVITQSGQRWDVSPHLLKKVVLSKIEQKTGKVTILRKKK